MRGITLAALITSSLGSAATGQQLTGVVPDVIPAGAPVVVMLRGRSLAGAHEVRLQDCGGDTVRAAIVHTTATTVRVPASMLKRPCVLRVRLVDSMQEIPLAVADPTLLRLPGPPPPDPDATYPWTGQFNMRCDEDTTGASPFESVVAVTPDSAAHGVFVLGKGSHVVMRVTTRSPKVRRPDPSAGCVYVVLPGVDAQDVQADPNDVALFWIGTLASDGRAVRERQYLSAMVPAP